MNMSAPLSIKSVAYVPLRPDTGGYLTLANVRAARWPQMDGCAVRISIYGLGGWQAGVPDLIGRMLAEGGAVDVELSASARTGVLRRFTAEVVRGARAFRKVMADDEADER